MDGGSHLGVCISVSVSAESSALSVHDSFPSSDVLGSVSELPSEF